MKPFKLAEDLYWNGILGPGLRVFDIVMMTEFGTTYNSYTLRGSEKTALFETCKQKFWDEYEQGLDELGQTVNTLERGVVETADELRLLQGMTGAGLTLGEHHDVADARHDIK